MKKKITCVLCFLLILIVSNVAGQQLDITVFLKNGAKIIQEYDIYALTDTDTTKLNDKDVDFNDLMGKDLLLNFDSYSVRLKNPLWNYKISLGIDASALKNSAKILLYDEENNKSVYYQGPESDAYHYVRYIPTGKHKTSIVSYLNFYDQFIADKQIYKDSLIDYILTYVKVSKGSVIEKYNVKTNSFTRDVKNKDSRDRIIKREFYENSYFPLMSTKFSYQNDILKSYNSCMLGVLVDSVVYQLQDGLEKVIEYKITNDSVILNSTIEKSLNYKGLVVSSVKRSADGNVIEESSFKYINDRIKYSRIKKRNELKEVYYNYDFLDLVLVEEFLNGNLKRRISYSDNLESKIITFDNSKVLSIEIIKYF